MAGNPTEWITVSDFTPGIYGDVHGAGGLTNPSDTTRGAILRDGAATIEHTYACHADASGALVPLPARTSAKTQTLLPEGNIYASIDRYPTGYVGAYLMDAHVIGGASVTGNSGPAVFALWQFYYSPLGTASNYKRMMLGRSYRPDGSTFDFLWDSSDPTVFTSQALSPMSIVSGFGAETAGYPISFDNLSRLVGVGLSRGTSIAHSAAAIVATDTPLTTYDTDVSANYMIGTNSYGGWAFIHPDPTGTSTSVRLLSQQSGITPTYIFYANPYMMAEHQGRFLALTSYNTAVETSMALFHTRLAYTAPLDPASIAGPTNLHGAIVLERGQLQGFGAMASLSADELLVIGHSGGALLIRGDVANPTIVQLPYVESTHGLVYHPAVTPIGVVYASRRGIYVWSGGDTSKRLSGPLDGVFFDHVTGGETYANNSNSATANRAKGIATKGRLGFWHPFVCVPNNYLYDIDSDAWWRLCAPSTNYSIPYNVYQTDAVTGLLYAFPYKITNEQNSMCDAYDPAVLAAAYSWRSQPLVQSRDRNFTIQTVELVASNPTATNSTVTVTVEGIDDAGALTSRTVTFTLTGSGTSGGRPQIIRQSLSSPDSGQTQGSITARYIQFRIEASNATVAPKIMSVGLGITDRSSVAAT